MAISYNIYANDGQGGLVNYETPIASTSACTHSVGPLAASSDNTFAVRAFDSVSGIEEANTDARVRIIIDATGNDVTARPNAVIGLSVRPMAGGTCWVSWGYDSTGQGGAPSEFRVSLTSGPGPSIENPTATVAFSPGVAGYGCTLSGLAANALYTVAVQAIGASSVLSSPVSMVSIHYRVNPLSNVDSLTAIPRA
jgi:hypothetical protein